MEARTENSEQQEHAECDTKIRILDSACELFAKKGFKNTTTRDIAQAAGVNLALINYHFGGKNNLYESIIENKFVEIKSAQLPAYTDSAPPETQLYEFTHFILGKIFDTSENSWKRNLVMNEILNPQSPFHEIIYERIVKRDIDFLRRIIVNITRKHIPETRLNRLTFSIFSQIVYYYYSIPIIQLSSPKQKFTAKDTEEIAREITEFSLAALKNMKFEEK